MPPGWQADCCFDNHGINLHIVLSTYFNGTGIFFRIVGKHTVLKGNSLAVGGIICRTTHFHAGQLQCNSVVFIGAGFLGKTGLLGRCVDIGKRQCLYQIHITPSQIGALCLDTAAVHFLRRASTLALPVPLTVGRIKAAVPAMMADAWEVPLMDT